MIFYPQSNSPLGCVITPRLHRLHYPFNSLLFAHAAGKISSEDAYVRRPENLTCVNPLLYTANFFRADCAARLAHFGADGDSRESYRILECQVAQRGEIFRLGGLEPVGGDVYTLRFQFHCFVDEILHRHGAGVEIFQIGVCAAAGEEPGMLTCLACRRWT